MFTMCFRRFCKIVGVAVLLSSGSHVIAADQVNAQLPWHEPVLDAQGRLLSWYHPEKNLGYDKVERLGWDFLEHKVPNDTKHKTGLKIYLINSVFDPETLQGYNWQHDPAMLFGTMVDSLVAWYPYSGDEEAIGVVRSMLDYQLAHGTTPADWEWPNVPFATSCNDQPDYGRCIQDMPQQFYGGIETDKIGELGIGYVLFYELTGERRYLDAGIRAAQTLAKHVRPGDAMHTPWAYRVDARSGEVLAGEEYGGAVASPLRLLDELIRLGESDTAKFRQTRDLALKWLREYPLNPGMFGAKTWDKWSGYFEDVPKNAENLNQAAPTYTAFYLLTRPDPAVADPEWRGDVGHLIDWVRDYLGVGPFLSAWAINEQRTPSDVEGAQNGCCSRVGLGSDTSRWAAINAMYYELTGDLQAREQAFRSLNYATYFAGSDGRISCCGIDFEGQYWFSDGYGDYLRHFMWAMGAIPEWAPVHENHLLRSSSVVRKVSYGAESIAYDTFDAASTEVLRLNFKPVGIMADGAVLPERKDLKEEGYTVQHLPDGDEVVRIRHVRSGEIKVRAR